MADNQVVTKPAGQALLTAIESAQLRKDVPELASGDTVRLQVKVVEGNRERLQPFEGIVMRLRGHGVNRNFTVRRITNGVGVERTFLLHSPRIEKIEVHASCSRPPQTALLSARSDWQGGSSERSSPNEHKNQHKK